MLKEYTFLLKSGFRTRHVYADTLREAIKKNKAYKEEMTGLYQRAYPDDTIMSGWLRTKQVKGG